MDGYDPVPGKCNFWRERLNDEDRWDSSLKKEDRRVECSCFVEGDTWQVTVTTVPSDCPERFRCRYYVKNS